MSIFSDALILVILTITKIRAVIITPRQTQQDFPCWTGCHKAKSIRDARLIAYA